MFPALRVLAPVFSGVVSACVSMAFSQKKIDQQQEELNDLTQRVCHLEKEHLIKDARYKQCQSDLEELMKKRELDVSPFIQALRQRRKECEFPRFECLRMKSSGR
ncbi:MAG: hypothetical protein KGJ02_04530 [Verrucomicrobiota bacterium]|nr:hypothetical protein [Verrucomicrobiota bacterium]